MQFSHLCGHPAPLRMLAVPILHGVGGAWFHKSQMSPLSSFQQGQVPPSLWTSGCCWGLGLELEPFLPPLWSQGQAHCRLQTDAFLP